MLNIPSQKRIPISTTGRAISISLELDRSSPKQRSLKYEEANVGKAVLSTHLTVNPTPSRSFQYGAAISHSPPQPSLRRQPGETGVFAPSASHSAADPSGVTVTASRPVCVTVTASVGSPSPPQVIRSPPRTAAPATGR